MAAQDKKIIAVVEDEAALRDNYRGALERHGYHVICFADRPSAETHLYKSLPDLAIIDVGLGNDPEGGFELCRHLRHLAPKLPIIFLTARDSELDIISGLRLGADDYLTKDISLPHLMARINALLRRVETFRKTEALSETSKAQQQGSLTLDLDRIEAHWKGISVQLTVTEFWIVHALAAHPGHVKNRTQLMEAANTVLDDSTVTSHVKRIRKKFILLDDSFDCIKTVYAMGYRWIE